MLRRHLAVWCLTFVVVCGMAAAQPGPDGYDWAQIGAVGNAPYTGFSDPISPTYGRGGVSYAYSMSRTEVTTAQWVSFLNAANARPDPFFPQSPSWTAAPLIWGGERDPTYTGPGIRYRVRADVPSAGMLPASGVSWRECAILCNWLNSGQNSANPESFRSGAYDTATFTGGFPTFTDQRQHTPGAHYWIPTLDEYLKVAFYDPSGNGPGQERWWQYPIRSDSPPIYGPPPAFGGDGTAQANAGFRFPQNGERLIPLGSYPTVQSPWGLLDLAGCAGEWLEEISGDATEMYSGVDGSYRGSDGGNYLDELTRWGSESPNTTNPFFGVRLASDVPAPGTLLILSAGACVLAQRERRRKVALRLVALVAGQALSFCCGTALAQPSPDGYDWAQIGAVGNAPYTGFSDPLSPTYGRGGISYSYSLSRTEVTTAQWVSFLNAANARPDPVFPQNPTWTYPPLIWGGEVDPTYTGPGTRYRVRPNVPNAAMLPASGVQWRECAILCNWLNSGQSSSAASFRSGSYDTATFTGGFPTFNDQRQHTPGAHYWIPTLDEYLKAAFYDPSGNGPGQERWWQYPIRSDSPPIYGPPPAFGGDGTAQANAGFRFPQNGERLIPLGSYPSAQSPWGLLDLAGCSGEWLEEFWLSADGRNYRVVDGSYSGSDGGNQLDALWAYGQDSPNSANPSFGVRLASDVPAPGTLLILSAGACVLAQRERRRKVWQGIVSTSSPPP